MLIWTFMARRLYCCNFISFHRHCSNFPELFFGTKRPSIPTKGRRPLGPYDALSKLRTEKDPDKVLQIFKEASKRPRFHHHRSAYEIAVKRLARCNRFDAVEEILEHEKKQVRHPTEGFMVRIIMLYGRAGMPDQAIRTFRQMTDFECRPTVKSLNAVLSALVQAKCFKQVGDLYAEIINSYGINPNVYTFNIVVKALCELNLSDSARAMLDEMCKNGFNPDIITFNTLMAGLYREGKTEAAGEVLEKMCRAGCVPNVTTYNIRILSLCKQGNTGEAEQILGEMRVNGVNPDVLSYNTLINGFCKEGNLKEANRIFTEMPGRGCNPNNQCYYTLIYYLCLEEDFDWAFELCNESISKNWVPNITIMKMLVDGLVKSSKIEEAREVIGLLRNRFPANCIKPWDTIEKNLSSCKDSHAYIGETQGK